MIGFSGTATEAEPARRGGQAVREDRERPGTLALVHDHLMQRGGAERVALLMTEAFPGAPLYTSFYDAEKTYPEFEGLDVRTSRMNGVAALRRKFRFAMPLMAGAFDRMRPSADVTLCSSSGWAHGARPVRGRTVVYCHAPARWLYQQDRYLGRNDATGPPPPDGQAPTGGSGQLSSRPAAAVASLALSALGSRLRRWDRRSAARADRYLANSTATASAVESIYGIRAEVLPPPPGLDPAGPRSAPAAVEGAEPGFWLCVARLLPYKNVDVVMDAVTARNERLVVVGDGPQLESLRSRAPASVRFTGSVDDSELRWLYENCEGLLAASYEDFGLTPLEAASFGKPTVALRWGGFLDTVEEDVTGTFFDAPDPEALSRAMDRLRSVATPQDILLRQAEKFGAERFVRRLQEVVGEELELVG